MTKKYEFPWRVGSSFIALQIAFLIFTSSEAGAMNWKEIYKARGLSEEAAAAAAAAAREGKTGPQTMEIGRKIDKDIKAITDNTNLDRNAAGAVAAALAKGGVQIDEKNPNKDVIGNAAALVKAGMTVVSPQALKGLEELNKVKADPDSNAKLMAGIKNDPALIETLTAMAKGGWVPQHIETLKACMPLVGEGPAADLPATRGTLTQNECVFYMAALKAGINLESKADFASFQKARNGGITLANEDDFEDYKTMEALKAVPLDQSAFQTYKALLDKDQELTGGRGFLSDQFKAAVVALNYKNADDQPITVDNITPAEMNAVFAALKQKDVAGKPIQTGTLTQEQFNAALAAIGKRDPNGSEIKFNDLGQDEFDAALAVLGKTNQNGKKITVKGLTQDEFDIGLRLIQQGQKVATIDQATFTAAETAAAGGGGGGAGGGGGGGGAGGAPTLTADQKQLFDALPTGAATPFNPNGFDSAFEGTQGDFEAALKAFAAAKIKDPSPAEIILWINPQHDAAYKAYGNVPSPSDAFQTFRDTYVKEAAKNTADLSELKACREGLITDLKAKRRF